MTTKEIAEAAGVSVETVRSKGKELFPSRFAKGKAAVFDRTESVTIMADLRKKGFFQPTGNLEVPPRNLEAVTRSDLADFGRSIVAEMMRQFIPMIADRTKQIEFVQDYFTIKGYASKIGQQVTFSEAVAIGREAARLSREKGMEVRKVDDERFGQVNSYSVAILDEVFQS